MTTTPTNQAPLETTRGRHSWVPYITLAAGAVLLLAALVNIASEARVAAPVDAVLHLGGIALALAAAIGTGLRRRRGRRTLTAIGLTLLLLAWIVSVGDLLTPVFELISEQEYVNDEGPFALLGLVLLGLGARSRA